MNKVNLKSIIIIFLAVAVIVIGFYFYQKNDSFKKNATCAKIGNSYFEQESEKFNYVRDDVSSSVGIPEFSYSRKLNSCFYSNTHSLDVGTEIMNTEYYITDLSTNEKIASYIRWDKGYDDYKENPVYIEDFQLYYQLNEEIFRK